MNTYARCRSTHQVGWVATLAVPDQQGLFAFSECSRTLLTYQLLNQFASSDFIRKAES
jgi:hypothetical protein